jgi:N-acylglucosamine 2-epimerase
MSAGSSPAGWSAFAASELPRVRAELAGSIVPFWQRTLDRERGGVLNCWDNAGLRRVSTDKFTWSQGRFIWLWSRLAELAREGWLPGTPEVFLEQAARTARFLERHAFLLDGRCAFLLSEHGHLKEALPGHGPAPSIYADCFVVMGFAEHARVSGDRRWLDRARELAASITRRVAAGAVPTHPEPIPEGYDSHAIAMITLNVALVLRDACAGLADPRQADAEAAVRGAADRIFADFMLPGGRIIESRPRAAGQDDTLLARHVNPGHALEGLWMLLGVAALEGRADWLERARESVLFHVSRGWDEVHGGLLHYVDAASGPPAGREGDSMYERNVRGTWDTKLWWVHSEALYTTALAYRLTGDERLREWFVRLREYTFRVFPNPDRSVGEWIQIRNRRGEPLERVVALPVKDPYHIARNFIQLAGLFAGPGNPLS